MNEKEKIKFLLHVLIPVVCCIIPGYFLYPLYIFKPYLSTFQIITTSFIGSVFLASLKITGIKNAIGIFLIFAVLNSMLLTKPVESGYVLRDAFHYAGLLFSIFFFFRIFYSKSPPALYPIYTAVIFAVVFFIAILILSVLKSINRGEPLTYYLETVFYPVIIDTIIGFCIGVGTFIADRYLPLKEKTAGETEEAVNKEKAGSE
jgi:hypothetical protein